MLGYELSIREIIPFDVFISIRKKKSEQKETQKNKKKKEKNNE